MSEQLNDVFAYNTFKIQFMNSLGSEPMTLVWSAACFTVYKITLI